MITAKLKREAKIELTKLRQHATKEELNKLSLRKLEPFSSSWCIYGQITGWCYNRRAHELLHLCAIPYAALSGAEDGDGDFCNGKFTPKGSLPEPEWTGVREFHSAVETLIAQNNYKINENVIDYLQRRTDVFNF